MVRLALIVALTLILTLIPNPNAGVEYNSTGVPITLLNRYPLTLTLILILISLTD